MSPTFASLRDEKRNDRALQIEYLASLKAGRIEGLIIEHEADSAFFQSISDTGWRRFSSTVLFCGRRVGRHYQQWFTLIYDSSSHWEDCKLVQSELVRTGYPVRLLDIQDVNPKYHHAIDGSRLSIPIILEFCKAKQTHAGVIDSARVNSVFWGYAVHNPGLVDRFISESLLKDHFISEGADSRGKPNVFVSDLDAVLIGPNNEVAVIEIKHKRRSRAGGIGLNSAPATMAQALVDAGIQFIYLVLEKPDSEPKSTMYLYFDRKKREQAEWIGRNVIRSDLSGEFQYAPAHTAIGGHGGVSFLSIPVDRFSSLGKSYERSAVLQRAFARVLSGEDKK